MSRAFDQGKNAYGAEHRAYAGQNARHILGNDFLEHYGANPNNYGAYCHDNYRMGDTAVNGRDTRLDNAIIGEVFSDAGHRQGYDAQRLANGGISRQQQLDRVGARFDMAKQAYQATGEHKYLMMQKDLRMIADQHLDADLRGFRLS